MIAAYATSKWVDTGMGWGVLGGLCCAASTTMFCIASPAPVHCNFHAICKLSVNSFNCFGLATAVSTVSCSAYMACAFHCMVRTRARPCRLDTGVRHSLTGLTLGRLRVIGWYELLGVLQYAAALLGLLQAPSSSAIFGWCVTTGSMRLDCCLCSFCQESLGYARLLAVITLQE